MMQLFPHKTPSYMIYRVFVSGAFPRRKKLSDNHAISPFPPIPLFCFWSTELTLLKQHREKGRCILEGYHSAVYLFSDWMRENTNNSCGVYPFRTEGLCRPNKVSYSCVISASLTLLELLLVIQNFWKIVKINFLLTKFFPKYFTLKHC